jgi:hypothetical protein
MYQREGFGKVEGSQRTEFKGECSQSVGSIFHRIEYQEREGTVELVSMTITPSGMSRDTFNDGVSSLRMEFSWVDVIWGKWDVDSGVRDSKSLRRNMIWMKSNNIIVENLF